MLSLAATAAKPLLIFHTLFMMIQGLFEMVIKLGTGHNEVLRLSQELDQLINVIQKNGNAVKKSNDIVIQYC